MWHCISKSLTPYCDFSRVRDETATYDAEAAAAGFSFITKNKEMKNELSIEMVNWHTYSSKGVHALEYITNKYITPAICEKVNRCKEEVCKQYNLLAEQKLVNNIICLLNLKLRKLHDSIFYIFSLRNMHTTSHFESCINFDTSQYPR